MIKLKDFIEVNQVNVENIEITAHAPILGVIKIPHVKDFLDNLTSNEWHITNINIDNKGKLELTIE